MAQGRFVSYLRVSTDRQGRSGLGLEAQRQAVADYLNGGRWQLVAEHVEVESGRCTDRPQLATALAACRAHRAKLVIARLDRLSRNAAFLMNLRDAGVDFVAADMPDANRLTIGILAVVAEAEAEAISTRTRLALAASKKKLGGARITKDGLGPGERGREHIAAARAALRARADARAADLAPMIEAWRTTGITSQAGLARALNAASIPAARGGKWSNVQVGALLRRLEAVA